MNNLDDIFLKNKSFLSNFEFDLNEHVSESNETILSHFNGSLKLVLVKDLQLIRIIPNNKINNYFVEYKLPFGKEELANLVCLIENWDINTIKKIGLFDNSVNLLREKRKIDKHHREIDENYGTKGKTIKNLIL